MSGHEKDFGSPDADADHSRGSLHLQSVFIIEGAIRTFMESTSDFLAVAGPKGVGKTLLLFNKNVIVQGEKKGALVAPQKPPYAFRPSGQFADSIQWAAHAAGAARGKLSDEAWTGLWEWALATAVLALWRDNAAEDANVRAKIDSHFSEGGIGSARSQDPYVNVCNFLVSAESGAHSRDGRLVLPSATQSLDLIAEIENSCPQTYLYIDNQDDFFTNEPDVWIASSFGAFRAIRTIRAKSAHRVHCCIALRSEVIWKIAQSADATRYRNDIFVLDWDPESIRSMLGRRVALLRDDVRALFRGAPDGQPTPIQTEVEGEQQSVMELIQRLAFQRPRDVIFLGNAMIEARARRSGVIDDSHLGALARRALHTAAGEVAMAYLGEVAHRWPWTDRGYPLERFLQRHVACDIMTHDQLVLARDKFAAEIGEPAQTLHPFCALAQVGLLGWPSKADDGSGLVQTFPSLTQPPVASLPGGKQYFLFHPALQERFSITPNGRQLIGAGRRFDEKKAAEAVR